MIDTKKQMLFQRQAEIVQAIGHPIRIAVIDFLKDGEQCVCDIAEYVGSERSNVSKHLSIMVSGGILEHRKEGLKVIYRLKCPCILDFFTCISGVLKNEAKENRRMLTALR